MMKPALCLMLVALIALSARADEDIFQVGVEALNKKEFHFAIACFNDVLRKEVKIPELHYYLGLAHRGKGDNEGATRDFKNALEIYNDVIKANPKDARSYIGRGNVQAALKDYKKAIDDQTKAIQLDPKSVEAYINRGNTYKQMGDKKAFDDFSTAIRLKPNDPLPYFQRGDIYFDAKDYDKAIKEFNSASLVDPNLREPFLFTSRGRAYLEKKDYTKAIEDFSEAIRLHPKSYDAYFYRARAYSEVGDLNKAEKDSNKCYELKYPRSYLEYWAPQHNALPK